MSDIQTSFRAWEALGKYNREDREKKLINKNGPLNDTEGQKCTVTLNSYDSWVSYFTKLGIERYIIRSRRTSRWKPQWVRWPTHWVELTVDQAWQERMISELKAMGIKTIYKRKYREKRFFS